MKTIKLPIKFKIEEDLVFVKDLQRQFSSVVRWAYNRWKEGGLTEKEIRSQSKSLKSVDSLNSWLVQTAILEGKQIFKTFKSKQEDSLKTFGKTKKKSKNQKQIFHFSKVKSLIFGGKRNLIDYQKGLITKEQYRDKKLMPVSSQGEVLHGGNRMYNFDFYNSLITLKLNKCKHIEIQLPNLHNNLFKELCQVQELCDRKQITVSVKLTYEFIYLTYEEPAWVKPIKLLDTRYLSVDMNPNNVGVSICENISADGDFKILETINFDLSGLTLKSGKSSDSKKSVYLVNKLQQETIEIAKAVHQLSKKWNCKFIFLEDLNFKQGDSFKGKAFNRLTKNVWNRQLFTDNLEKRCKLQGQRLYKVNAAYTSTIGNLTQEFIDPINSSIEIGRRGYNCVILNNKKFYPELKTVKTICKELWKQTFRWDEIRDWKEIHEILKKSGLKYRVLLADCLKSVEVFSLNSIKSKVKFNCFT